MLRRNLRHTLRNPSTLFMTLIAPLILSMFVYIFGGAFNVGVEYINYVVPGIIVMSVAYGVGQTAVSVSNDMTQGIIARFRTMAISRASAVTGHVVGTMIRTLICIALIIGVRLIMGFRPTANVGDWFAATAVIVMLTLATSWLTVALGLAVKTVEGASFAAFPLTFLPFISSAFAPPNTMPSGVRWFTDNQPFTPVIETLRGLLTGTPIGNSAVLAIAWCAGIALVGYLWARALFNRDPAR
jgi:ABC-2 type transport system permease protein